MEAFLARGLLRGGVGGLPFDAGDDGLQAGERDVAREAERGKLADQVPDPFLRETAYILGDAMRVLDGDRALAAQVLPQSTKVGSWVK